MKYRLIGIDVDGTLLGPDHALAADVARAVRRARQAGLLVVLATGRTYAETIDIWRQLALSPPFEPMVAVGGALVCEPDTGRSLYQKTIALDLAERFAEAVGRAGYAAMATVDPWRYGWDCLLCETGDVHAARRDWLDKTGARVRSVRHFRQAVDMPAPLRINVVVDPDRADTLAAELVGQFDGQLNVHAIRAPNYDVTIVEAFAAGADKFTALCYASQAYRIAPGRIAAVGDDVNDLAMIRGAGMGIAMPRSSDEVRSAAGQVARDGLAALLDRLAADEFD